MHEYDAVMGVALDEARAALAHDDVPVGAVIVRRSDGEVARATRTTSASARAIPPRTPSSSRSRDAAAHA